MVLALELKRRTEKKLRIAKARKVSKKGTGNIIVIQDKDVKSCKRRK